MILAIDGYRAAGQRMGVGRHIEYLLRSWAGKELPFQSVRVITPEPLDGLPRDERFSYEVLPTRGPGLWWQNARLRPRVRDADVLFAPYVLPPGYGGRSVVLNCAIYEGAFAETFPGWRSRVRSRHFAHSARRANRVIAISESAKSDLGSFYDVPAEQVDVVWPGVDEIFRPMRDGEREQVDEAVARVLGERAPYFLFVGKLSLRRSVPQLLEAFARVVAARPELRLLLVGQNTSNLSLDEDVARLGMEHAVCHVDFVDHPTLALLYRGARAFVLPTAHEGFSATINEALASGTPALVREHRSLYEGGLDGAVLAVSDSEPTTLADALERLADDDALCADLSRRGPVAMAPFTWDECARRTMTVLWQVAMNGRRR